MASSSDPNTLDRLIAACRDAESLYGYAADRVDGLQLQPLLNAAAGLHRETGEALQPHLAGAGAATLPAGTLTGKFRQLRGGLRATFAADGGAALLAELEDAEAAVVRACEGALASPIAPAARTVLARRLGIFRATRECIAEIAERAAA